MHIFYQADPALHPTPPGHPERPHRLMAAAAGLSRIGADWQQVRPVDLADAGLTHDAAYIGQLAAPLPAGGSRRLDQGDTIQSETSLTAALGALGGAGMAIAGMAAGDFDKALVLARSPGHHACRDRAMGFCLLGSAAWAALHARDRYGLRVAVLDFDLHHGNGTEDILEDQKDVFFASSQQDGIWPGTGSTGISGHHGHIVNTALPRGTGSDEMRRVWRDHFRAMRDFGPDLIIVSAGFDAHANDPLSGLSWTIDDYGWLGEAIADEAARLCEGRVLVIPEGGYDLEVLQAGIARFSSCLSGAAAGSGSPAPAQLTDLAGMASPYIKGRIPPSGEGFGVRKLYGRLWLVDGGTGTLLYTPPEFLQLRSRQPLIEMAERANATGRLDIGEIIALEAEAERLRRYNPRRSADFAGTGPGESGPRRSDAFGVSPTNP